MRRIRLAAALAPYLIAMAATPAIVADNSFLGGLVGGVMGGIIANQAQQQRQTQPPAPPPQGVAAVPPPAAVARPIRPVAARPAIAPATKAENLEIQEALNLAGCDAGVPDGAFGRRTTTAIQCLQAKSQAPMTGSLNSGERTQLIEAYRKVMANSRRGAPATPERLIAAFIGEDPAPAAAPAPQPPPSSAVAGAGSNAPVVNDPGAGRFLCADNATLPRMPAASGEAKALDADMTWGNFCGARDALMEQANESLGSASAAPAAITAQCAALLDPKARAAVAGIDGVSPEAAIAAATQALGVKPRQREQVIATAMLCVGIGYIQNNSRAVEGAAMLGLAAGDRGLSEVIAWHLALGVGRAADPVAGRAWVEYAYEALKGGATPAVEIPEEDRASALYQSLDGAPTAIAPPPPQPPSQAEAEKFFTARANQYQTVARSVEDAMEVSIHDLLDTCQATTGGEHEGNWLMNRLCLAIAATSGDRDAMERADRVLADAGDPGSARALALYPFWN